MKTLREELKDLYEKSMTATEQTNRIIASAKISAEEGMDSIYVWLDKDTEYEIAANLTNEFCKLTVVRTQEEEDGSLYEISWV